MDKIKIVIADDNSFIREGLKIILSSYEEVCVKFFSIRAFCDVNNFSFNANRTPPEI